MSDERFKAIGMDDIGMPGGWSVSDGQTFLYTPAEREIMRQSRAFVQREILPHAAARTSWSRRSRPATRARSGATSSAPSPSPT